MADKVDWEPSYGFCGMRETDRIALAEALELVRRRVCAYNMGIHDGDVRCDCKYGASIKEKTSMGSERTGCPELREIINRLLHRPETLEDDPEYVYRVVDKDGNFAKPVSTGYRAPTKPNERRYSQAKGLYTTQGRANAAIRGGVGARVQRGQIVKWEDVD
jgi:hypothetical protein